MQASDLGHPVTGLAPPPYRDLPSDLERALVEGHLGQREVKGRDGRWRLFRTQPYEEGGRIAGTVLTVADVTGLKSAQAALGLNEERYRTIARSLVSVFFSTGRRGEFLVPQTEWTAYTGQDWEHQRGKGWIQAFHPADRDDIRRAWKHAIDDRTLFEVEARIWSRSANAYRTSIARAAPVLGADGGVVEWLGRMLDIHDRRRTEQELQAILDHAQAAISLKDLNGRYLRVNHFYARLLKQAPEEITGRLDSDLLPQKLATMLRRADRSVARSGEILTQEEQHEIDAAVRTFLATRFPLKDASGKVTAVAGIWTDVTEMKETQEAVRRQRTELEHTNELLRQSLSRQQAAEKRLLEAVDSRDRFLATLSHELRNPLGAILNSVRLLEHGAPEAVQAGQAIIARQARQMARLLDDLLDIARVARGKIVLKRSVVDLRHAIEEAAESLRSTIGQRLQELRLELGDEPLLVDGDPARLQQIHVNLLANASKYTPPGGHIRVRTARELETVVVTVEDDGSGIPPDMLERIFELFEQCRVTLDRSEGGMGVGLTLVRSLVTMHAGEVRARSDGPGRGSTFEIRLPVATEALPPLDLASDEGGLRRLRIAIIEDNPDSRDSLRMLLELEGHEVITAKEGIAGVQLIFDERPDVALVDIGLPHLDGYQLATRVRERLTPDDVLLVALTGYGSSKDLEAGRRAGFDAHFVKPLKLDELTRLLRSRARRPTKSSEAAAGEGVCS